MKLKYHTIWPLALMLIVNLASGQSKLATPNVGFSYDKIVHFLVFGLIATTVLRIPQFISKRWKGVCATVVIVAAYGMFDEFRQSFTVGRFVDAKDWIADTSGAILASIIYLKWDWYRRTLERPCFDNRRKPYVKNKQVT